MTERTHTSGPWLHSAMAAGIIVDTKNRTVANCGRSDHPFVSAENYKNARLISAAPDLLAALESMVDMFERHIDGREGPDDAADRWDAAQAAIDKATN
jgi:hypothetical protein